MINKKLILCFIVILLIINFVSASKFVVVGHFRTLNEARDIRELFIQEVNDIENLDAIIFTGDIVEFGTQEEWDDLNENVFFKLNAEKYFVPGNHDLSKESWNDFKGYDRYVENIGYTSKKIVYNDFDLYLLNSVYPEKNDFNYTHMEAGSGLDEWSLNLLKNIETDKINLLFLHHSLYSSYLWHQDMIDLNSLNDKNKILWELVQRNEEEWNKKILPLINNNVQGVFMGDGNLNHISEKKIENVTYYGNALILPRERLTYTFIEIENNKLNVEIRHIQVPNNLNYKLKFIFYKIDYYFQRIVDKLFRGKQ